MNKSWIILLLVGALGASAQQGDRVLTEEQEAVINDIVARYAAAFERGEQTEPPPALLQEFPVVVPPDGPVLNQYPDMNPVPDMPWQIPDELKFIIPPQVGDDTSLGFFLKMDITGTNADNDGVAWWSPAATSDKLVAVTNNATPGFLGEFKTNGVLRTDLTIDYSIEDAEAVLLSANASNIWIDIVTNDYYGSNVIADGTCNGQVLWWEAATTNWINTTCPTNPSVWVYDETDDAAGTVHPVYLDSAYKGVYRGTNGNIVADWVRAHN